MNNAEMLTKELFEKSNISFRKNNNTQDSLYTQDLAYGIKRVLNLDVILDREKDKRIVQRLTPLVEVTDRERKEIYSNFAYDFYELYKRAKINLNDKSPNKSIKELREIFVKKRTRDKKLNPCFITIK